MTNKKNPNRRGSIQVSISGHHFDKIWSFLESCDDAEIDRSTEIWRLVLTADKNEGLQAELSKNYPDEYMTDQMLEHKINSGQLPPSWSILPRVDIDKAVNDTVAMINVEEDMADPERLQKWKASRSIPVL